MIYKASQDKSHRCPVCWTVPDGFWEPSSKRKYRVGRALLWAIYSCRNGHKFSRLSPLRYEG